MLLMSVHEFGTSWNIAPRPVKFTGERIKIASKPAMHVSCDDLTGMRTRGSGTTTNLETATTVQITEEASGNTPDAPSITSLNLEAIGDEVFFVLR